MLRQQMVGGASFMAQIFFSPTVFTVFLLRDENKNEVASTLSR